MVGLEKTGLYIDDRVRWVEASETIRGIVTNIGLMGNKTGEIIPHVTVEYQSDSQIKQVEFYGKDDLAKLTVIFRGEIFDLWSEIG